MDREETAYENSPLSVSDALIPEFGDIVTMISHSTDYGEMDQMIRCVSARISCEVERSVMDHYTPSQHYQAFCREPSAETTNPESYSVDTVHIIFSNIAQKCRMEMEYVVLTMLYLERLPRLTDGAFRLCPLSWRDTLSTCMLLVCKLWNDNKIDNSRFADICSSISLSVINRLEILLLQLFNYSMFVSELDYWKGMDIIQEMIFIAKYKSLSECNRRSSCSASESRTTSNDRLETESQPSDSSILKKLHGCTVSSELHVHTPSIRQKPEVSVSRNNGGKSSDASISPGPSRRKTQRPVSARILNAFVTTARALLPHGKRNKKESKVAVTTKNNDSRYVSNTQYAQTVSHVSSSSGDECDE
mmetsp:Transcript_22159/g.32253  ORF Transcript_22159/g.32253 Transcript_22159/m.32253 type:complete len:361 (+) Transcript_22159:90-1172(+)